MSLRLPEEELQQQRADVPAVDLRIVIDAGPRCGDRPAPEIDARVVELVGDSDIACSPRLARHADVEEADDGLQAALDAGDYPLALECLLTQHGDYIYGYCRHVLGNDTESEDVSQTVFTQAYQDLKNLSDPRAARAWLRTIAHNRCMDRWRARKRDFQVVDDHHLCTLADEQCAIGQSEHDPRIGRVLDECLACLDARSREVLVLRFHHGLSFEAISELTGDTSGALRTRLTRALPRLRRCLERKGVRP